MNASFPVDKTVVFELDVGIWCDILGHVVFVGPESHARALDVAVCGVDEVECLVHGEVCERKFCRLKACVGGFGKWYFGKMGGLLKKIVGIEDAKLAFYVEISIINGRRDSHANSTIITPSSLRLASIFCSEVTRNTVSKMGTISKLNFPETMSPRSLQWLPLTFRVSALFAASAQHLSSP